MIRRLTSWIAWVRFQRRVSKARAYARSSHGRVNEVNAKQRAVVHAALARVK